MNDDSRLANGSAPQHVLGTRFDRRGLLRGSVAGLGALGVAGTAVNSTTARSAGKTVPGPTANAWSGATINGGGLSPERLARTHEVMAGYVARGEMPGLVTLISRRGEVHVDAIGTLASDGNEPMRRDTIFRLASMTKPIAAVAALILVEEAVLRLDDPVDALLPELSDRQVLRTLESEIDDTVPANRPITLRDLLTFRLGYGAIFAAPGTFPIQQALEEAELTITPPFIPAVPPDEYMRRFENLPLLHQPGERWLYHTGSDILGVLIARATGMSFGELLQERLFAPLGMKDTSFVVPPEKLDRLASSYGTSAATGELELVDGGAESLWSTPPVFESGGAGLVSTVDDMLVFGEMLRHGGKYGDVRVLARPTVEVMTTDQLTPEQKVVSGGFEAYPENQGWGFGVGINLERDDLAATPGRFGWDGGFGTSWHVDPQEELVGIWMTQRLLFDASGLSPALRDFWTLAYAAIDD